MVLYGLSPANSFTLIALPTSVAECPRDNDVVIAKTELKRHFDRPNHPVIARFRRLVGFQFLITGEKQAQIHLMTPTNHQTIDSDVTGVYANGDHSIRVAYSSIEEIL